MVGAGRFGLPTSTSRTGALTRLIIGNEYQPACMSIPVKSKNPRFVLYNIYSCTHLALTDNALETLAKQLFSPIN